MMSIAADNTNSSSDSGRDSPRTTSSLSNTWCTSCSSWPEQGELKSLWVADTHTTMGPHSGPSLYESEGLYRCASLVSVDSMASTFLPSISPGSPRSPSTTRIGTPRQPSQRCLNVLYRGSNTLVQYCIFSMTLHLWCAFLPIFYHPEVTEHFMSLCWLKMCFLYLYTIYPLILTQFHLVTYVGNGCINY